MPRRKSEQKPPKLIRSAATIRTLDAPEAGQRDHPVVGSPGLYLRVSSDGTKSFCVVYRWPDPEGSIKSRRDTFGRWVEAAKDGETGSLKWARAQAERIRGLAANGEDPREARQAEKAEAERRRANTFEVVVADFIEKHAKPRQRTWKETARTLGLRENDDGQLVPIDGGLADPKKWGKRPFAAIATEDAQTVIDDILAEGKVYKAKNTRAWLVKLWRWAAKRKIVAGPIMDMLDLEFAPRIRDRRYSDEEIKALWSTADRLEPVRGAFLKLVILLAPRAKELAGLRFDELDDPDNPTLWTVPTSRTKTRKTHEHNERVYLVPLPSLAQRIVKTLPRTAEGLAFPGRVRGKPLDPGSPFRTTIREASAIADFTFHAARHTLASWLKDQGHSVYERGLCLNHSESGVTAGYSHGFPVELKRQLLEKWADHVAAVVGGANVAVLR